MAEQRLISDSDLAEIRALLERKIAAQIDLAHCKQKIIDLKNELFELTDSAIGKDYKASGPVIRLIRAGRTYKDKKYP